MHEEKVVQPASDVNQPDAKPPRPTCSTHGQQYMTGQCSHGNPRVIPLSCNRPDCEVCTARRMARYRYEIRKGIEQQPDRRIRLCNPYPVPTYPLDGRDGRLPHVRR